jgi:Major intrinsic protein
VAVDQGPWHSVNSDIYHDNPDCQTGNSIAPENIRQGTGGNRLCEECARLNNAAAPVTGPVGDLSGDLTGHPQRDRREEREEDLLRREEAATSWAVGSSPDEPRVRRLSEDAVRNAARRGTREALDEKEQEESGGGGLYGSQIDAPHILGATVAELVGTFILVFGGTAVAVGAILSRPTAGGAYGSLAIALAFGLALAIVVASIGHVSGAHVNPAVTLGMAAARRFPWNYVPHYVGAQLVGAVLAALATWVTFGGGARLHERVALHRGADHRRGTGRVALRPPYGPDRSPRIGLLSGPGS